jgi:hypothetical protein
MVKRWITDEEIQEIVDAFSDEGEDQDLNDKLRFRAFDIITLLREREV